MEKRAIFYTQLIFYLLILATYKLAMSYFIEINPSGKYNNLIRKIKKKEFYNRNLQFL